MNMSKNQVKSSVKIRAKLLFSLIISAALTVIWVLLPPPATMKSKAQADFNVGGNRKMDGANLTPFTPLPPGSLDPTFGIGGKVTTPILSNDVALAVAIQSDGKIVTAGYSENGTSQEMAIVRYNANGTLDTAFGGNGKVTIPVAGTHSRAFAVAIQTDGKIVAAGDVGAPMGVVRLNPNGSLDAAFDGDGILTVAFYNNDLAHAVAIQPDGKIVIAGYSEAPISFSALSSAKATRSSQKRFSPEFHTTDFAIARLNPDGSLDATFGNGGKVLTGLALGDVAYGIVIQPDGKIVAAGETFDFETDCIALVRYNANGSLDPSFANLGAAVTCSEFVPYAATSVTLQPDGKIVAAGISGGIDENSGYDFALARFTSDGLLDNSFSDDGKLTTEISQADDECWAVAIQSNGKILAAGFTYDAQHSNFALARYNPSGSLDTSFDSDGKVTTDFSKGGDWAFGLGIQPDGLIVTTGRASSADGTTDFAVARYFGDATAPLVSVGGRVTTPDGRGLRNAIVALTDPLGVRRTATTSSFGIFMFDNVATSETYVIGVSSKRYRFASRNLMVNGSLTDVDFVGLE